MKRFILILLVVVMLMCGCDRAQEQSDDTQTQQTAQAETDTVRDDAYLDIERRDAKSSQTFRCALRDDADALILKLPSEWKIAKEDYGFKLSYGKEVIGRIESGETQRSDEWKTVKSTDASEKGIVIDTFIERRGEDEYRYRFLYTYVTAGVTRKVTLTVKLSEVNSFVENTLSLAAMVQARRTDAKIGILADNSVRRIAILGNSFIGTSQIGRILQEMFYENGKSCYVDAVCIGMATVNTYVNDTYIMSDIRSGYYDIVFICGFYSSGEINNLKTLKAACDASNTKLVIFPAHNENASVISSAMAACPDLVCLNWKNEIETLISKKNISKWKFCVDDQYDHSTELAGLVGAHLIYRAIYSSLPDMEVSSAAAQLNAFKILGDYLTTGNVEAIKDSYIYFFN